MTGVTGKHGWPDAVALAVPLSGYTTIGPNYVLSRPTVPAHWREAPATNGTADVARPLKTWWREFDDSVLDRLRVVKAVMEADGLNYERAKRTSRLGRRRT